MFLCLVFSGPWKSWPEVTWENAGPPLLEGCRRLAGSLSLDTLHRLDQKPTFLAFSFFFQRKTNFFGTSDNFFDFFLFWPAVLRCRALAGRDRELWWGVGGGSSLQPRRKSKKLSKVPKKLVFLWKKLKKSKKLVPGPACQSSRQEVQLDRLGMPEALAGWTRNKLFLIFFSNFCSKKN